MTKRAKMVAEVRYYFIFIPARTALTVRSSLLEYLCALIYIQYVYISFSCLNRFFVVVVVVVARVCAPFFKAIYFFFFRLHLNLCMVTKIKRRYL